MSAYNYSLMMAAHFGDLVDKNKRGPQPSHFDFFYGFSVRIVVGLAAIVFACLFAAAWGGLNGWVVTSPLLVGIGLIISITIFIGEHVRSRVYERVLIQNYRQLRKEDSYDPIADYPQTTQDDREGEATGLQLFSNRLAKRTFDLLFAITSLVVLWPLLALIVSIVKIDSPGPIFYSRKCRASNGGTFRAYRFRIMHIDIKDPFDKEKSESYITNSGTYLMVTGFYLIPSLLNVIKGDMSVVGPPLLSVGGSIERPGELLEAADKVYGLGLKPGFGAPLWLRGYPGRAGFDYDFWRSYYRDWSLTKEIVEFFRLALIALKAFFAI